ncbi:MAG TPA: TadE/TadG family type IV pilus assembly protein [Acetobacteraceae bacterium]|nr:TadE/TadG family type IV pilus assembly protein [Acetobacteraceae bacterium]
MPDGLAAELDLRQFGHPWQQLHRRRHCREVRHGHGQLQHHAVLPCVYFCAERLDDHGIGGADAMRRRWRDLPAARQGVVAIEFAMVAVPLIVLTLGTIEFGRLMWTRQALEATAIQVARCVDVLASYCESGGAYNATDTTNYAEQVVGGWGIALSSSVFTINSNMASSGCAGLSQVSISYTFQTVIPGLLFMLSGGEAVTAQACFPNQT